MKYRFYLGLGLFLGHLALPIVFVFTFIGAYVEMWKRFVQRWKSPPKPESPQAVFNKYKQSIPPATPPQLPPPKKNLRDVDLYTKEGGYIWFIKKEGEET